MREQQQERAQGPEDPGGASSQVQRGSEDGPSTRRAGEGSAEGVGHAPPSDNMGVQIPFGAIVVGVDHAEVTVWPQVAAREIALDGEEKARTPGQVLVMRQLQRTLPPGEWVKLDRATRGYDSAWKHGSGAVVAVRRNAELACECHVTLRGETCAAVEPEAMRELLAWVVAVRGNVSRLDLAGDDYEQRSTPGQLGRAWRENRVTRVRSEPALAVPLSQWGEQRPKGWTVYIGSKASEQRLRVYDKATESDGEVLADRWELQCRDDAAQALAEQLVEQGTERWGDVWAARVVGLVDFREGGSKERHVERLTRCAWFQGLVGAVKRLRSSSKREPVALMERRRHLVKQYGSLLAALTQVESLEELGASLLPRMKQRDREALKDHLAAAG